MSKVTIPSIDRLNFQAWVSYPSVMPAPVVIVIQEIFGINDELKDKCDDLAREGYLAIAPDLFWRIEPGIELVDSDPEQLQRAFQLFGQFDQVMGLQDLKATLKFARTMSEANGRCGAVGYCLGGRLAFMMAEHTDVDAVVSYYGVGLGGLLAEAKNVRKPVLLHIAAEDEFVPKEEQQQIIEGVKDYLCIDHHIYPGVQHAFARGQGMHYNEEAATLANTRTSNFLSNHVKRAKAA